jgi:enamine deaminase RidA (YjgF/YER057c/UK114 family)
MDLILYPARTIRVMSWRRPRPAQSLMGPIELTPNAQWRPNARVIRFVNPPELAPPPGYSNIAEIRGGRLVYIAGQAALDRDGSLVGEGNLEAQADQAFRNLATALSAVGCTVRDIAKLTVFIRDMRQLAAYRRARDRFFGTTTPPAAPAVTLVEVSKLFDDKLLIEIEAVAVADR